MQACVLYKLWFSNRGAWLQGGDKTIDVVDQTETKDKDEGQVNTGPDGFRWFSFVEVLLQYSQYLNHQQYYSTF